jgi:hypothetical protein
MLFSLLLYPLSELEFLVKPVVNPARTSKMCVGFFMGNVLPRSLCKILGDKE